MKFLAGVTVIFLFAQVSGPKPAHSGDGAGITSGVITETPEQPPKQPPEQPTDQTNPGCSSSEDLVTDSAGIKSCVKIDTPTTLRPVDCTAQCLKACKASSPGFRKNSQCRKACVKERCGSSFRCKKVFFTTLNAYMFAATGSGFSASENYLLDESRGSLAAVKDRQAEVKSALDEMRSSPDSRIKYYNQLAGSGCSVKTPADAIKIYRDYNWKLLEWGRIMESSPGLKKLLVPLNKSGKKQAQKKPIEVDRDFADTLLLSFESCGLTNWAMDDYFRAVSFKRLAPDELVQPAPVGKMIKMR